MDLKDITSPKMLTDGSMGELPIQNLNQIMQHVGIVIIILSLTIMIRDFEFL